MRAPPHTSVLPRASASMGDASENELRNSHFLQHSAEQGPITPRPSPPYYLPRFYFEEPSTSCSGEEGT